MVVILDKFYSFFSNYYLVMCAYICIYILSNGNGNGNKSGNRIWPNQLQDGPADWIIKGWKRKGREWMWPNSYELGSSSVPQWSNGFPIQSLPTRDYIDTVQWVPAPSSIVQDFLAEVNLGGEEIFASQGSTTHSDRCGAHSNIFTTTSYASIGIPLWIEGFEFSKLSLI